MIEQIEFSGGECLMPGWTIDRITTRQERINHLREELARLESLDAEESHRLGESPIHRDGAKSIYQNRSKYYPPVTLGVYPN